VNSKNLNLKVLFITLLLSCISFPLIGNTLKIYTYNILADSFLGLGSYSEEAQKVLEWKNRKEFLLQRILDLNADILCLQEVESSAYEFLSFSLAKVGYLGNFAQDASKYKIGVATFFKQASIHCLKTQSILCEGSSMCGEKAVRAALINTFQSNTGHLFYTINTKLKWLPDETPIDKHPGFRQIQFLIDNFIEKDKNQAWILSGDFNLKEDHPIIQYIEKQGLHDPFRGLNTYTFFSQNESKKIDYLLCSPLVKIIKTDIPLISTNSTIPSKEEPSDHLPLGVIVEIKEAL
jgi:endonuclease/exonuclease/phosphatase family metal-dependent hydrolase